MTIRIDTIDVTNFNRLQLTFSMEPEWADPLSPSSATNLLNYTFSGGFREIKSIAISKISSTVFDLIVDEMTNLAEYNLIINTAIKDVTGAHLFDSTASTMAFVGTGERPRISSVTNPISGIIQVDFSDIMLDDSALLSVSTYVIEGAGEAKPVFIEGVSYSDSVPTRVLLSFSGGSDEGVYSITVTGVMDIAGNYIDPIYNMFSFPMTKLVSEDKADYYLDTNLGAIQLTTTKLNYRSIEDLATARTKSQGYNRQFQLITRALRSAGINRDHTKLKLLKG